MKAVIQRVNYVVLMINDKQFSSIKKGLLVFLGVEKGDTKDDIDLLKNKICKLRIFEDDNEKMNLSIKDVNGEMMIVSQFTLCADCKKGNRPSFIEAELPEVADQMYEKFIEEVKKENIFVQTGKFGEYMKIEFENDGPVTIILDTKKYNNRFEKI